MLSLREDEIEFSRLTDRTFEECCLDLLTRMGFHDLQWRQGGADKGRDIEGYLPVNNRLVGSYPERWFFECKRHSRGVPPDALASKIAWADAERPHHLVFFITSYLSNAARDWLERQRPSKSYRIHTLEGKGLKSLILRYPDLVQLHFGNEYTQLVRNAKRQWLLHDLLPEPAALRLLCDSLLDRFFSISDLAFLWCSLYVRSEDVDAWCEDNEPFCYDHIFAALKVAANWDRPVLSDGDSCSTILEVSGFLGQSVQYSRFVAGRLVLKDHTRERPALYTFVRGNEGEGLETVVEATSDCPFRIRYVSQRAGRELRSASDRLLNKFPSRTGKDETAEGQ